MNFILTTFAAAGALLLSAALFSGITISGIWAALLVALVLGVLNALVRPILLFLTFPINVVTLGLFTFVINALLLWLAVSVISGVAVAGFWSAFLAALVVSLATTLVDSLQD